MTSCGDKKIQVLKVLRELTGLGLKEAKDLIDNLPKVVKEGATKDEAQNMKSKLEEGEDVLISGFGKFCVKTKNQRRGRNPATGDDLTLPARKVVTFKCSGKLRNKINGYK